MPLGRRGSLKGAKIAGGETLSEKLGTIPPELWRFRQIYARSISRQETLRSPAIVRSANLTNSSMQHSLM
jgi:hypothetical protein